MPLKTCPRCGEMKALDDFYKNKKKVDGHEQYCKVCSKEYRKGVRNPEVARAGTKAWMERNPERVLAIHRERERRIQENYIEDVDESEVWRRSNGICGLCGQPVDVENMYIDHILPLSKGGEHSYANTQAAHELCNLQKGSSDAPVV